MTAVSSRLFALVAVLAVVAQCAHASGVFLGESLREGAQSCGKDGKHCCPAADGSKQLACPLVNGVCCANSAGTCCPGGTTCMGSPSSAGERQLCKFAADPEKHASCTKDKPCRVTTPAEIVDQIHPLDKCGCPRCPCKTPCGMPRCVVEQHVTPEFVDNLCGCAKCPCDVRAPTQPRPMRTDPWYHSPKLVDKLEHCTGDQCGTRKENKTATSNSTSSAKPDTAPAAAANATVAPAKAQAQTRSVVPPSPAPKPKPQQTKPRVSVAHWSYEHKGDDWSVGTCLSGRQQSPIDIPASRSRAVTVLTSNSTEGSAERLDFFFRARSGLQFKNDGHTIQVSGDLGYVVSGGSRRFNVKHFDFHTPSEHTIDGKQADMEMHIELQSAAGGDANERNSAMTVSVLFNSGPTENRFLKSIGWKRVPTEAGKSVPVRGAVDLNLLSDSVGSDRDFFLYDGSLSLPACEETMAWRVMKQAQSMSPDQLAVIRRIFAANRQTGNNRKTQPLNGRPVQLYTAAADNQQQQQQQQQGNERGEGDETKSSSHWSYDNTQWSDSACAAGTRQSPINIVPGETKLLYRSNGAQFAPLYNYHAAPAMSLVNNGHALQVEGGDLGYIEWNGLRYNVAQFHFHTPSEHTVDSADGVKDGYSAMEMHIVHKLDKSAGSRNGGDSLFVIAVMFDVGAANEFLNSLGWMKAPGAESSRRVVQGTVDLMQLYGPLLGSFYAYEGSLTTPPCSEIATWRVMKTHAEMSQEQLDIISTLFTKSPVEAAQHRGNNRPTQPLNGRTVYDVRMDLAGPQSQPTAGQALSSTGESIASERVQAPSILLRAAPSEGSDKRGGL